MNFKQYYERESKKTCWQRERDLNKRLIGKRVPYKEQTIRSGFEIYITKKANPKGWMFNAVLMCYALTFLLCAFLIMLTVELGYTPMRMNTGVIVDTLLMFAIIGFSLTAGVYGVVARRRKK